MKLFLSIWLFYSANVAAVGVGFGLTWYAGETYGPIAAVIVMLFCVSLFVSVCDWIVRR